MSDEEAFEEGEIRYPLYYIYIYINGLIEERGRLNKEKMEMSEGK